jgi:hypothetical protein
MSNAGAKLKDPDSEQLIQFAIDYCEMCINHRKEVATPRGAVEIKERHIPTVGYFLYHYLRDKVDFVKYTKWCYIQRTPTDQRHETIKQIVAMFKALATDIVANEGKGIFYAKNYLDMTDKVQTDSNVTISEIKISYE